MVYMFSDDCRFIHHPLDSEHSLLRTGFLRLYPQDLYTEESLLVFHFGLYMT